MTKKKRNDAAAPAQEPNIAFVGARIGRSPIVNATDGDYSIALPAAEYQSEPFYHEDASRIIALFPKLYKAVRPK